MKFSVGKCYETRDGQKVKLISVGEVIQTRGYSKDAGYTMVGLMYGKGAPSMETFRSGGQYMSSDNKTSEADLIAEWVDPVYTFFPVLKSGPMAVSLKTYEEAANEGVKKATDDDPLVGYGRIEHNKNKVEFFKIGTSDSTEPELEAGED